jgi:hypothetical protein
VREQHALDRRLAPRHLGGERATLLGDSGGFSAHAARLGGERRQRSIGGRDGALRIAQRVAGFALRKLLLADFLVQLLNAPAQRLEVFFLSCGFRREDGERRCQREKAFQTFAFPCAATEATRRATSPGSPR